MGRAIDWEARRRDDETTRRRDHKTAKNNAGITRIISKFRSPAVSQSRSLEVSKSRSPAVPQSPEKHSRSQPFSGVLSLSQAFSVFPSHSQLRHYPAHLCREGKPVAIGIQSYRLCAVDVARKDALRQLVYNLALYASLDGSSAIERVEACLGDMATCRGSIY